MPIKLNTASSGSVTLDAANTASNFTVTIPAVTATMLNNQSDITAQVKTATSASGDAPIYSCRAWVNFNGTGTVAIRASGNVSSITDLGTGNYRVNITNAMTDSNFSVVVSCLNSGANYAFASCNPISSSAVEMGTFNNGSPSALADINNISVAVFR